MSKSYLQIVKQIEVLKIEAEKLRKQEVDGVVKRIREAIEHYGLTAADLGLGIRVASSKLAPVPAKKLRGKGKAAKPVAIVKFRDEAGNTWGGRGKRPQWLRDALNSGKQLSDFLVK